MNWDEVFKVTSISGNQNRIDNIVAMFFLILLRIIDYQTSCYMFHMVVHFILVENIDLSVDIAALEWLLEANVSGERSELDVVFFGQIILHLFPP